MINSLMNKLVLAGTLMALAACQAKVQEDNGEDTGSGQPEAVILSDDQISMAGILTGAIEGKTLSDILSCNGSVEVPPQSEITVSLPMESYVRQILFYSGSRVRKGDLLAVMGHPDFLTLQQEYLVSGNDLILLKQDYERQKNLAEADAVSEKKLMTARTDYENTRVRHAALGEQLRLLGLDPGKVSANSMSSEIKIYSPINGYVRMNYANAGELMEAGQPILELEDVSHLHLHLVVFEKDIRRVRKGQPVEFTTEAREEPYHGTIHTVGQTIHDETRSADVHVHISDPDQALLSGMYVKAKIHLDSKVVHALPEGGVIQEGGRHFIFLREGDFFRRIQVETGIRQDGYVEIKSPGNLAGREIVTAAAYYLNAELGKEE